MRLLKSIFAIVALFVVTACSPKMDVPEVEFRDTKVMVSAKGGEIVVPVFATGIDDVNIYYDYDDRWEYNDDGDLIPTEGWIELVKVVNRYSEVTRDLPMWQSGIVLNVAPNEGGERTATLEVRSYAAVAELEIVQTRK